MYPPKKPNNIIFPILINKMTKPTKDPDILNQRTFPKGMKNGFSVRLSTKANFINFHTLPRESKRSRQPPFAKLPTERFNFWGEFQAPQNFPPMLHRTRLGRFSTAPTVECYLVTTFHRAFTILCKVPEKNICMVKRANW